jgi:hypothetical protein
MKPSFNTISDGKKVLADLWESYDFLYEIDKIKQALSSRIDTLMPDEISRASVKLSILLCNLGVLVAEITAQSNESYIFRKFMYAWEYTVLKVEIKGKAREEQSLMNTIEHHRQELVNRFVCDYLKTYKDDIERVVSNMQSRLRTLQQERINSNSQV